MAIMDDLSYIECRLSSLVDDVNRKGPNKDLEQALLLICLVALGKRLSSESLTREKGLDCEIPNP